MSEERAITLEVLEELAVAECGDLRTLRVPVPEWRGTVYLRELPAGLSMKLRREAKRLTEAGAEAEGADSFAFLYLAHAMTDPTGRPLVSDRAGAEALAAALVKRGQAVLWELVKKNAALQGDEIPAVEGEEKGAEDEPAEGKASAAA